MEYFVTPHPWKKPLYAENNPMNMSVGRLWVLRLPIIWVLGAFTALGATGVWIAMLLSNALTVLYGHIVYKTKDWSALHYAKGEQS